jgi:hypothetical protein
LLAAREATALHDMQIAQLASTTANAMTVSTTTNTASSSGSSSSGVTSGGGGVIPPVDPFAANMKALKKA